jgi:hypothetical protein
MVEAGLGNHFAPCFVISTIGEIFFSGLKDFFSYAGSFRLSPQEYRNENSSPRFRLKTLFSQRKTIFAFIKPSAKREPVVESRFQQLNN